MIVSLNLITDTGTPGWVDLEPPAKYALFRTNTNGKIKATLGNMADNGLPKGYAVTKAAIKKPQWQNAKTLYLHVSSFMALKNDGGQYHHLVPVCHELLFKGIQHEDQWFAFMVVDKSTDPEYRYWPIPVLIHH